MLVKTRSGIQISSSPAFPLEIALVELSHNETILDLNTDTDSEAILETVVRI